MSIALPDNRQEKWARYRMLVRQGSMDYVTAVTEYVRYCKILRGKK